MLLGYKLLLWIGILIIVLPFLGVPIFWKEIILFLIGMILITRALVIKNRDNA
jgi:hypothetical protein